MRVKPKFMQHEENGESAFEPIMQDSFEGKWKVIFFYPKDFTFVCPTEIAEFARLGEEFADRDAVVMGGSTDNEFTKLAWRRDHQDLNALPAKLRMNVIGAPVIEKADFELFSMAVSAVNGCGMCLDAHEAELRKHGLTTEQIQTSLRIGAVVNAVARVIAAEDALA